MEAPVPAGNKLRSLSQWVFVAVVALASAVAVERASSEVGPQVRQLPDALIQGSVLLQSVEGKRIGAGHCQSACAESVGCRGYASTPDGACVLYSAVSEQIRLQAGATSGVLVGTPLQSAGAGGPLVDAADVPTDPARQCPEGYETKENISAVGGALVMHALSLTFDRCAERCSASRDCAGFVWLVQGQKLGRDDRCQLKSRLSPMTKSEGALLCQRR